MYEKLICLISQNNDFRVNGFGQYTHDILQGKIYSSREFHCSIGHIYDILQFF